MPLICAVVGFRTRPDGSVPLALVRPKEALPPVALTWELKGRPSGPAMRGELD